MSFQFQCPQGHLLEGDASQAGQAIPCPVCGMMFVIPAPIAPATNFAFPPQEAANPMAPAASSPFANAAAEVTKEPVLLHIPCPKGHALEVPEDMLNTEVLCPKCGEQFLLRARDSYEHKRKREIQEAAREEKTNKFWLNVAITAAVLSGLLILSLLIAANMNAAAPPKSEEEAKKKALNTPVKTEAPVVEQNPGAVEENPNAPTSEATTESTKE